MDVNTDTLGKFIAYGVAIATAAGITTLVGEGPWIGIAIMCVSILLYWER